METDSMSLDALAFTTRRTASHPSVASFIGKTWMSSIARALIVAGGFALGACSDAATAPEPPIDRVAAARVMPSVTDARVRLAQGIENAAVRDRVTHDLQELALGLTNGDGRKSRFHVRVIGSVLDDYKKQGIGASSAPDITAISLVLYAVSQVVGAGYEISP
jgi:hypothetical protein